MKKVNIEYTVYEFNELSEEVKIKLIEKEKEYMKDQNIEFWLSESMEEKAQELLKELFSEFVITDIEVYYDLGYSQGSGSMIQFTGQNDTNYLKVKHYGRYNHELSFTMDYEYQNNDEVSEEEEKAMKERIYEMNIKLTKHGYDFIEYPIEDLDAIERLSENTYLKDGSLFDC